MGIIVNFPLSKSALELEECPIAVGLEVRIGFSDIVRFGRSLFKFEPATSASSSLGWERIENRLVARAAAAITGERDRNSGFLNLNTNHETCNPYLKIDNPRDL